MAEQVIVIRYVGRHEFLNASDWSWYPHDILYVCHEPTYGCVDWSCQAALTRNRDGSGPFFAFPSDAITDAMPDIDISSVQVDVTIYCDKPGECPNGPGLHLFVGPDRWECCARQDWEDRQEDLWPARKSVTGPC